MRRRVTIFLCLAFFLIGPSGCMTAVAVFQPKMGDVIVLTTTDSEGASDERVLSPIDDGDRLYVSANHWPRAWYRRALENPRVQVTRGGKTSEYVAVPVTGDERADLLERREFPFLGQILTGFAHREFLRLEPPQEDRRE